MSIENSKLSCIGWEIAYGDGSGVETAVRYFGEDQHRNAVVEFENCLDKVQIPADKIDWLIECLLQIKDTI